MQPTEPDEISRSPRTLPPGTGWRALVVVLAVALMGALAVAVHYRHEAAMLHRQVRSAPLDVPSRRAVLAVSTDTVPLPAGGRLAGEVTVFVVRSPASHLQVVVTARITGGRPDSPYVLSGGDCADDAADHAWAWGTTDSHGSADLAGRAWTVSAGHEYYIIVEAPGRYGEHPGLAVHGHFGLAGRLSAVRYGFPPCAP